MINFPRLKWSTGDNVLDLLACAWAAAFYDAESDVTARAELLSMFDPETLNRLHRLGIIRWDPAAVPMQAMMEVGL